MSNDSERASKQKFDTVISLVALLTPGLFIANEAFDEFSFFALFLFVLRRLAAIENEWTLKYFPQLAAHYASYRKGIQFTFSAKFNYTITPSNYKYLLAVPKRAWGYVRIKKKAGMSGGDEESRHS